MFPFKNTKSTLKSFADSKGKGWCMKNLCPDVYRQRLVVEATYTKNWQAGDLTNFVVELSNLIGMHIVYGPMLRREGDKLAPIHQGIELYTIWAESSCLLYTWEKFNFVTVDIYTCKKFEKLKAVEFIKEYFGASDIDFRGV
jgi:S-adenosylmethionine/arginine decarboxylase-like enzyme